MKGLGVLGFDSREDRSASLGHRKWDAGVDKYVGGMGSGWPPMSRRRRNMVRVAICGLGGQGKTWHWH